MRLVRAALTAALFVLACPALAQPKTAVPPADDVEAAKAHFAAGSAYYDQANYADAVKEFNEAYRLSKRTDLLYNIAIAYERLNQLDNAIATLQKYLTDKPNAPDRVTIESRIQNLSKRRDEQAQPPPPNPNPNPTPVVTPPLTTAPVPRPLGERKPRWWLTGTIVIAAGAVVALSGAALAIDADIIYGQLVTACKGNVCDPSQRSKVTLGQDLALSADILFGVGGATALVGVILLAVQSRRPAAPATHARLRPTANGFAVTF
jgi:tetratricopeptide (TPR) repeat protein